MIKQKKQYLFLILFCTVLFGAITQTKAEQNDIVVEFLEPNIHNDSLTVSLTIAQLFSPKSLSTLQSGIQSLIKIDVELLQFKSGSNLLSNSSTIEHFEIYRSLSYNIWDEKYYIKEKHGRRSFETLEEFTNYSCNLVNYPLVLLNMLDQTAQYSLRVMVQFFPISEEQSGKVEAWLTNPNQTRSTLASEDNASGFQLSSSKLVSLFLGKKNRPENTSKWYTSDAIGF